jgi:TrpR-related protein YerC/YecD
MPKSKENIVFFKDLALLKTPQEFHLFFTDLCTPKEISDMSDRWKTAKMIDQKISYRNIYETSGVSTATVTRVARCLKAGAGGYRLLLNRLFIRKKVN